MMNFHQDAAVNTYFSKGFFIEVPGSYPVQYRPLEVVFDDSIRNQFENHVEQTQFDLTSSALVDIARKIIRPSQASQGVVGIEGSWEASRFAFQLEFITVTPNATYVNIIGGYTDKADISYGDHIAPDTMMFINNHQCTQVKETYGRHGHTLTYAPKSNDAILRPINVRGHNGSFVQCGTTTRPEDMYTLIDRRNSNSQSAYDGRFMMTNGSMEHRSARTNASPAEFLSTFMRAYSTVRAMGDHVNDRMGYLGQQTNSQSERARLSSARNIIAPARTSANSLFQHLANGSNLRETGVLMLGELMHMFPDVSGHAMSVSTLPRGAQGLHHNTHHWAGDDNQTVIAVGLLHMIPAAMSSLKLASYSFTVTNNTLHGETMVGTSVCQPMFSSVSDVQQQQQMETHIRCMIIPQLIPEDVGIFTIEVDCVHNAWMKLSINLDGDYVDLAAPNYCPDLQSAEVATSVDSAEDSAIELSGTLDMVINSSNKLII